MVVGSLQPPTLFLRAPVCPRMATCTTVTVAEPEPDESTVVVDNVAARSPAPNQIVADVTLTNRITSGSGQQLSPAASITLNGGSEDFTDTVTLGPGESSTITVEFTDTPTGQVEVCAEAV